MKKYKTVLGMIFLSVFVILASSVTAAAASDWQLGPFIRPVDQPVIVRRSDTTFLCPMRKQNVHWESSDTFNPAAVVYDEIVDEAAFIKPGRLAILATPIDDGLRIGKKKKRSSCVSAYLGDLPVTEGNVLSAVSRGGHDLDHTRPE